MPSDLSGDLAELHKHYHDLLLNYQELHSRVSAIQDLLVRQKVLNRDELDRRIRELLTKWEESYERALDEERALGHKHLDKPESQ